MSKSEKFSKLRPKKATEGAPSTRSQLVDEALNGWVEELQQSATSAPSLPKLELSAAHPTGLAQLYAGRATRLTNLVREPNALAHVRMRAHDLLAAQSELSSGQGAIPMHLGIGTASWTDATDGTSSAHSVTALLRPLTMQLAEDDDILLTLRPGLSLNSELAQALRDKGLKLDISQFDKVGDFSPLNALRFLREAGSLNLVGFDMYESLTLGVFVKPADIVIGDLQRLRERAVESTVVVALAGDATARAALAKPLAEPIRTDRDPHTEKGVGLLDPLQHDALDAVAAGRSLVLDTPPASERAETIAAILIDAAVSGKRVAYVPGERRAATALMAYLRELGLDDLVLDLSDSTDWDRGATAALRHAITIEPTNTQDADMVEGIRTELVKVREKLGGYTQALHKPKETWGISPYDALQVLTDLTAGTSGPRTKVRFSEERLDKIAEDGAASARAALQEAAELGIFKAGKKSNPWHGAVISAPEAVAETVECVQRISIQSLPQVRANIGRVARETGLTQAHTLEDWEQQLELLAGVRDSLDVFLPMVFERSAADMMIATAPKEWRKERALNMKGSTRRRLVRQARDMVRPGVKVDNLHERLTRVQNLRSVWAEYGDAAGWPKLPGGLDEMINVNQALRTDLKAISPFFSTVHGDLAKMPVDDLVRLMDALAQDKDGAARLPERVKVLKKIKALGLEDLVDDLRARQVPDYLIPSELDLAWWASALSVMLSQDDRLAHYTGKTLAGLSTQLRNLDREQERSLVPQARFKIAQQVRRRLLDDRDQAGLLYEALAADRDLPLPQILADYPLSAYVMPIRIIPPLQMSSLFDEKARIDVVVLDGVERLEVAQLLPALCRASQVVVAGDVRRKLGGAVAEFAEILPHITVPPSVGKSNEAVTDFLASHGYGRAVFSVPVPRTSSALGLHLVDGRGMPAPGLSAIESSADEVEAVVDLVIEHALSRPDESLAVVTLNARHAQRIREAIISAVADSPAIDSFFKPTAVEPFVTLDAAHAAGLRRDRIILAVGFAKTPHGRVLHDFGAISGSTGPSLLVDALSAVRGDLDVVASFTPEDIDESRLNSEGARMLVDLLASAQESDKALSPIELAQASTEEESEPDRLLVDLAERLYRLGLTVLPNVGTDKGVRIPLAIGHPAFPDELLVAVLTDNVAYASEPSLRRRERILPARLAEFGWGVYTVYSTAVFMNPQAEAEAILNLVLDIVEEAQGEPLPESAPQPSVEQTDELEVDESGEVSEPAPVRSEPRPPIAPGLPLTAYGDDQLDEMAKWIASDGVERSESQMVAELIEALQIVRRGAQVNAVLANVARRNGAVADPAEESADEEA